jgi:hypothetical protein
MSVRIFLRGLAAISNPQMRQYDSISFTQYGLAFRIADGLLDGTRALMQFLSVVVVSGRIRLRNMVKRPTFRTEEVVPHSGIYRVHHRKHRLPHEVMLLKDQHFPRCAKCQNAVIFKLVRVVSAATDDTRGYRAQICLYELPCLDEETAV